MMDKTYDHKTREAQIYQKWEEAGVFSPEKSQELRQKAGLPVKNEPFTVLMPPPNANAPLHCGHATYSIQDLYARWNRMRGYKTLYVPGTDHAGFETQVVYERNLKKQGKSRFDFDRETLFGDILNFVNENSDLAINQLKRLGMSADWSRKLFMLDPYVIDTVYNTFIKMHEEGLVYRDNYLVNYSPVHGTTFSNLETEHIETNSPLYYIKYKFVDADDYMMVATVRPETIYGDVAICVNPKDERYKEKVGKLVINPLNGKEIPVIADSYVDLEFGTGALKITPGHDFNDFEIGKKFGLEAISLVDLAGRMTAAAGELAGMKVMAARTASVEILRAKGALEKIDDKYINNLLVDYKDNKPIEPMLLPNWFVKMKPLAEPAINAVKANKVKFNKPTWKTQILQWLDNIKDWPISRQTVFGIRMPVWYSVTENPDLFVVFLDHEGKANEGQLAKFLSDGVVLTTIKKGLQKVIAPTGAKYIISKIDPSKSSDESGKSNFENEFIQETDTFDTWYSSSQWPLTTLRYPENKDFGEFFPTSFMDSMWDILFFWIARMIMMSLYLVGDIPFKNVYIHGAIVDARGQKMSKSRGNTINPIDWVEKYGADALRMGIMVGGNTSAKVSPLSEDKVKGYRNFANKVWNMGRFMQMMEEEWKISGNEIMSLNKSSNSSDANSILSISDFPTKIDLNEKDKALMAEEDLKILEELKNAVKAVNDNLSKYRIADAGNAVYQFIWHEVADSYIEHVKSREDKGVALGVLRFVYTNCLHLLHPFMPFVTEAVWGELIR
jgi:valyl-tRNA synthetase